MNVHVARITRVGISFLFSTIAIAFTAHRGFAAPAPEDPAGAAVRMAAMSAYDALTGDDLDAAKRWIDGDARTMENVAATVRRNKARHAALAAYADLLGSEGRDFRAKVLKGEQSTRAERQGKVAKGTVTIDHDLAKTQGAYIGQSRDYRNVHGQWKLVLKQVYAEDWVKRSTADAAAFDAVTTGVRTKKLTTFAQAENEMHKLDVWIDESQRPVQEEFDASPLNATESFTHPFLTLWSQTSFEESASGTLANLNALKLDGSQASRLAKVNKDFESNSAAWLNKQKDAWNSATTNINDTIARAAKVQESNSDQATTILNGLLKYKPLCLERTQLLSKRRVAVMQILTPTQKLMWKKSIFTRPVQGAVSDITLTGDQAKKLDALIEGFAGRLPDDHPSIDDVDRLISDIVLKCRTEVLTREQRPKLKM